MKPTTFTKKDKQYDLINKNLIEVETILNKTKVPYRILNKDDAYTLEFVEDRINVVVENNKVIDSFLG